MRRIVGTVAGIAAFFMLAAGAQATVVFQKNGGVYVTSNAGKGTKHIATGEAPAITPNGLTVTYSGPGNALFSIPAAGGASVPLGGTFCNDCYLDYSPDSRSMLRLSGKGELDVLHLDGQPPTRVATGADAWASFSPDSLQIAYDAETPADFLTYTVPAIGGSAPVALADLGATNPVWTTAGIVVSDFAVARGAKPQFRVTLLDAAGKVKKVLQRKTLQSPKALKQGYGIQYPFWRAGANVVTYSYEKRGANILRLISTSNGKVKAKRKFAKNLSPWAVTANGKTLLATNKKGKLETINFKSGKRKTVIKSGVAYAYIN